jgi:hypothetical protein
VPKVSRASIFGLLAATAFANKSSVVACANCDSDRARFAVLVHICLLIEQRDF